HLAAKSAKFLDAIPEAIRHAIRHAFGHGVQDAEPEPSPHPSGILEQELELEQEQETGSGDSPLSPQGAECAGFAEFWTSFPKKHNKAAALKAWRKLKPTPEVQAAIREALQHQLGSDQWKRGVIPHASTWLNGRRWEDEV